LLDTEKHRYAPYWNAAEKEAILRWLPGAAFRDAIQMPFLGPEPTPLLSSLFELLEADSFSSSSILLLAFVGFGSFALLFRFLL